MKRQSNSTTLGQLPTFADYRRMRLLQPRRDFPTPAKEVQDRIKNINAEIEAVAAKETAGEMKGTASTTETLSAQ